jgi:hypothetical protein
VDAEQLAGRAFSRRSALTKTAGAAFLLAQAAIFEQLALAPERADAAAGPGSRRPSFPDIQYDLGAFTGPPQTFNDGAGDVQVLMPPVFTLFQPLRLRRTPSRADQVMFARALATIEDSYPASPSGVLVFSVSYGLPYFRRLPARVVRAHMPTLLARPRRPVLEESVAFPTDVVHGLVGGRHAVFPNVRKARFNVNVVIESNDIVLQIRSDALVNLADVSLWLQGSNFLRGSFAPSPRFGELVSFQEPRIQFVQPGLPRRIAERSFLEFAGRMSPTSPMAMGFADQQVNSAGPAAITTFTGNNSARLTSARPGDYFDNGSIAHFSHVIQDLYAFFASPAQDPAENGEPFTERVQYMFRANQLGTSRGLPSAGFRDQFTDGGGPAFINNVFQGAGAALAAARDSAGRFGPGNASLSATFKGEPRISHEEVLQQVSRAADGTPLHIRMDGPGFSGMDVPAFSTSGNGAPGTPGVFAAPGVAVPAGSSQFKLQFMMFVPTADLFAQMRVAAAAQELQKQFHVEADDNGLERFLTATRRQNLLVPPRRHRSMPLAELD